MNILLTRKIDAFHAFLNNKQEEGKITSKENADIVRAGLAVVSQSGVEGHVDTSPMCLGVFRQMLHVMKQTLVKMHPELADEVRNLGTDRPR